MRILVLCSDTSVPLDGATPTAHHLRGISHAFAQLGHTVEVVGFASADPAGWTMPVHALATPGRSTGLERDRRMLAATNALSRRTHAVAGRLRPEVVYERLSPFGTAGSDVVAATGACHVLQVDTLPTAQDSTALGLDGLARTVWAEVLTSADLRVTPDQHVRHLIAPLTGGAVSMVIPPGAGPPNPFALGHDRALARSTFGVPPDAAVLGFTGTLHPWHGLEVALTALAGLPERVRLVVAADGSTRSDLMKHAAGCGVAERVDWVGRLPPERLPEVLAACDVAVAPYCQLPASGFAPLKLSGYLAAGIPVIASDLRQIRQLLGGGRYGQLVTPGDPGALAAGVRADLADLDGAARRAELARARVAPWYGWMEPAARILDVACTPGVTRTRPARARQLDAMAR